MNPFSYLCSELTGKPLLMGPDDAARLFRTISTRSIQGTNDHIDAETLQFAQMQKNKLALNDSCDASRVGCSIVDGVGIIPIRGPLLHRREWFWEIMGFTSYEMVELQVATLLKNSEVSSLLFDVDTPGGVVSGCFDAARKIKKLSLEFGKPIIGSVNEEACSAGYALISACSEIYATETSYCGSIGVWTMHADYTKALDMNGVGLTVVRAGDRKARGGPYERADKKTMDKKQFNVDRFWGLFANLVADNRGVSTEKIYQLEGDVFNADEALEHGLIDGVGPFNAIFDRAKSLST